MDCTPTTWVASELKSLSERAAIASPVSTLMDIGTSCSRSCRFCAVTTISSSSSANTPAATSVPPIPNATRATARRDPRLFGSFSMHPSLVSSKSTAHRIPAPVFLYYHDCFVLGTNDSNFRPNNWHAYLIVVLMQREK